MKRKQHACTDYAGIIGKIRRGAYHTKRRLRRAVSRYHRANHADFVANVVPDLRAWIQGSRP